MSRRIRRLRSESPLPEDAVPREEPVIPGYEDRSSHAHSNFPTVSGHVAVNQQHEYFAAEPAETETFFGGWDFGEITENAQQSNSAPETQADMEIGNDPILPRKSRRLEGLRPEFGLLNLKRI